MHHRKFLSSDFMIRLAGIIVTCLFATNSGICQFKKIKSVKIASDLKTAAIDRPGDLYLVFNNGTLQKIDTEGKLQYSVTYPSAPTIFDPRDGARIFSYYSDTQRFVYLSPSLTIAQQYPIDEALAISPYLVCSFGDQHILILDSADWSLKKVHVKTLTSSFDADVNSILSSNKDFTSLREYQNFIFLIDPRQGILVFNAIGKFLKLIEARGITYFNFLGEELYYLQNGKLKFFNLFSTETRTINLPAPCDFAFLTDERLYLIKKNELEIFSLNN